LVTEWYPREGSRRPGRPYMRWNDEVKKFAGQFRSRIAVHREEWKCLREAFAQQWDI